MSPSKQGKKPRIAPTEESVQGSIKGKQPQKPPSQQPSTEQSVHGSLKQKPKSEKPQTPPSQQPSNDKSTQGSSKGKYPIRPLPEQPAQGGPSRERPRQLPLDNSIPVNPEVMQPRPEKEQAPSGSKGKQLQKPAAQQMGETEKAKGKQPMPQPIYGNPRFFILRIPVKRDAPIKRVRVSIGPDTAFRHPQTFFFKNIPRLEPFWGYTNDKAFTATRIVRLEDKENPMPYFLMVCRGEYPKVKSPRNNNNIFEGMDEPIFGDAFVFKLGDPELYGEGYARYVNIEEDIDGFDWLPEAIRVAARKVENAMAKDANPGFPDIESYADELTMSKDVERMLNWMRKTKKARAKYATAYPIDETSGLPDLNRMNDIIKKMTKQGIAWKEEGVFPTDGDFASFAYEAVDTYIHRTLNFQKALKETWIEAQSDKTSSASTIIGSPVMNIMIAVERTKECFMAAKSAFEEVEKLAKAELGKKALDALNIQDPTAEVDIRASRYLCDAMMMTVALWKKEVASTPAAVAGSYDLKPIEELRKKTQAATLLMERRKPESEVVQALLELNEAYQRVKNGAEGQEAAVKMKAAGAQPAPEADEDNTSDPMYEVQGLPHESGSTPHGLRCLI